MPPKTRFLHMIIYKMVFVCPLKLDFCMEYNSYSPKKSVFSHVFPQKLDFNTRRMQYVWPLGRMLNHVVANRLNTGGKPSTHLSMTPKSSRMGGKQVSFWGAHSKSLAIHIHILCRQVLAFFANFVAASPTATTTSTRGK